MLHASSTGRLATACPLRRGPRHLPAHLSLTATRGWAANSWNARIRLQEESDRLSQEIRLLFEELRIKDARMALIHAQRRPHYPPTERLAILETARRRAGRRPNPQRVSSSPRATVAAWMSRLDEAGPDALVQIVRPVNRFPDFVGYLVRRLKVLCPTLGKAKIAQVLARAGLHLGPTTIRRMLRAPQPPRPCAALKAAPRSVVACKPNDLWRVDQTTVPTALGFWTSWVPFALPQVWPFC